MSANLIPVEQQLSGFFLRKVYAETLMTACRPPRYVAWTYSYEHLQNLVSALHSPATTTYARCEITNGRGDRPLVAVPFSALKSSLQFALDCVYIFHTNDIPVQLARRQIPYEVVDFVLPASSGGTYINVPLPIAPPWEALPPAYVCCMERTQRLELLGQVLHSGTILKPVTLFVDNRDLVDQRYRAAPMEALQAEARHQLERIEPHMFSCLYASTLGSHPLLQPLYRRFKVCHVGNGE